MERRTFLQKSLIASILAAIFPSLIQGSKSEMQIISSSKDLYLTTKPSGDLLAQYPMTYAEAYRRLELIEFKLTNVYKPVHIDISGINNFDNIPGIFFRGAGLMIVKDPVIRLNLKASTVRHYDTIIISYKYEEDDVPVNLYVPASKLLKDGKFSWVGSRAIKNSAGSYSFLMTHDLGEGILCDTMEIPNERPGWVIEYWNDRIDVHLAT